MPTEGKRVGRANAARLTAVADLAEVLRTYVGPGGEHIERNCVKEAAHLLAVPMNATKRVLVRKQVIESR